MSGSFDGVRENLNSLIDHLERVQEEFDILPETAYGRLREGIENLSAKVDQVEHDLNGKLDLLHEDTIARIERMEATVMAKLGQLGPFWYPVTTTWLAKDTSQPWQPQYEQPYKITCEGGLANGMTYGSNSADIGEMAAPLRIYRRTRSCRR